ncbi:hypothetical protein D3C79_1088160 [compost metagenome]
MIMVVAIMDSIKNKLYLTKSIPINPVVSHIGKCHIPHQKPMIIEAIKGEYFF